MTKYALDPAWEHEKERLDAQASFYDAGTEARIEALGIREGWHCAEIGGGSGTITTWLSERVGSGGRVVATDLDTRFLDALDLANVEARNHNIVTESLEPEAYDLVHVRLVLMHLGDGRSAALSHMVEALRPGGWLLAEEMDAVTGGIGWPPDERVDWTTTAPMQVMQRLGADPHYGRRLSLDLERAGLASVQADGRLAVAASGSELIKALTFFLQFLQEKLVEEGLVTSKQVDEALATLSTPGERRSYSPLLIAAWGQRPPR